MFHEPQTQQDPMAAFFAKGQEFIKRRKTEGADPCFAISPGTEEWIRWSAYFRDTCGGLPRVMLTVGETGGPQTFTVPAQWPEWFDGQYVEGVQTAPLRVEIKQERPIVQPHPSWDLLASRGGKKRGNWNAAGESLSRYTQPRTERPLAASDALLRTLRRDDEEAA